MSPNWKVARPPKLQNSKDGYSEDRMELQRGCLEGVIDEKPLKIAFLGTRHPHVVYRFAVLDKMAGFDFTEFYEEVDSIAAQLAKELHSLKRFFTPDALLDANPDIVMIHSLDPDVPRWARFAISHPSPFKGLFLEEPSAAVPGGFCALAGGSGVGGPDLPWSWAMKCVIRKPWDLPAGW
jgi:hypothetical protein